MQFEKFPNREQNFLENRGARKQQFRGILNQKKMEKKRRIK